MLHFGPILLALAIAWSKRQSKHPLLGSLTLVFYGLKRMATPRSSNSDLPLNA